MKTKLTLRYNFSWSFVGNIVYAGCQWGSLAALAKLTNAGQVGAISLGLAVTAPIFLFSQLQLRTIQATDAKEEYNFSDYLGMRLLLTAFAMLIVGVAVLAGRDKTQDILIIAAVASVKAVESLADIFYGKMQQLERMDYIAKSRITKGILSLIMFIIVIYYTKNIFPALLIQAAIATAVLCLYDSKNVIRLVRIRHQSCEQSNWAIIKPRFNSRKMTKLAILALPLGCVMALISLNTNMPRYFIANYLGKTSLGIFTALAYIIVTGNMVISAMGQAAVPRLAKYYASADKKHYLSLLTRLTGLGLIIAVGGILVSVFAGRMILTILYSQEYAAHLTVFIVLMVYGGFNFVASFLGYGMTAARYFRLQLPLFSVVVLTTALASWVLIPSQGLIGAALSMITGALTQIIGSIIIISIAIHNIHRTTNND